MASTAPDRRHNHITRDIKPIGMCPACDDYHARRAVGEVRDVEVLADRLFGVYRTAYHEAIGGNLVGPIGELKLAEASEWERAAWMAVAAEAARRG